MNIQNGHFDLPQAQQILCVFAPMQIHPRWEMLVAGRPIAECDWSSLSPLKKWLLWKSYGQLHRDNPRNPQYMSELAAEIVSRGAPHARVDVWATDSQRQAFSPELSKKIQRTLPLLQRRPDADTLKAIAAKSYDAILLCYPDSIGYGWSALEKSLIALKTPRIWAVNGRRRVFPLNKAFRRKLAWRRGLEATWLVEAVFVLVLLPVSVTLAILQIPKRWFNHGR